MTRDDNDVDHHDLGSDHDPRHHGCAFRELGAPGYCRPLEPLHTILYYLDGGRFS